MQERKYDHVCTYGWGLERLLAHIYVWLGPMYMVGSEQRNNVVVMFMGSQPAGSEWNESSCSSGGLGRNSRWKRGLAYRGMEETALCLTEHVRNGILFIGRGLAYLTLLGKGLLVAHQFCLLMAHYWCATSTTQVVLNTNGAPLVRQ